MDSSTDIRTMLLEGQFCAAKPVTSLLPFPYHWVPGEVRQTLISLLDRPAVRRVRRDPAGRPLLFP